MQQVRADMLDSDDWVLHLMLDPYEVEWNEFGPLFITKLSEFFRSSADLPETYSLDQINESLWRLAGESGLLFGIFRKEAPLDVRLDCIRSMLCPFETLFVDHCTPTLSHLLRQYDASVSPLNSICYMWWDIFPHWGDEDELRLNPIDEALLELLQAILNIPHDACRESALHGLGHWHLRRPVETERIIDKFLAANKSIQQPLKTYALLARSGCVN
jgi:hypothetical protein